MTFSVVSAQLTAARFVTIVGAGGVGKTTVAVAVGHHLIEAFAGAVLFVDLGMLSDPDLVATAVASMLGLSVQSDDATPSLIAYLRDKRILLILDTCEHLIEAVAALAARIFECRTASPHPGDQPRGPSGRGRARLQIGSAGLSSGRSGAHGGGCRRRSPRPSCSWSARRRVALAWISATRKPPSWRASAESSTVWRSRSSWRPDASSPMACSKPLHCSTNA